MYDEKCAGSVQQLHPIKPEGLGREVAARAAAYQPPSLELADKELLSKAYARGLWRMQLYATSRKQLETDLRYDTEKSARAQEWALSRRDEQGRRAEERKIAATERVSNTGASRSSSSSSSNSSDRDTADNDEAQVGDDTPWICSIRCPSVVHLAVPAEAARSNDGAEEVRWVRACKPNVPFEGQVLPGIGVKGARAVGHTWCLARKCRAVGTDVVHAFKPL